MVAPLARCGRSACPVSGVVHMRHARCRAGPTACPCATLARAADRGALDRGRDLARLLPPRRSGVVAFRLTCCRTCNRMNSHCGLRTALSRLTPSASPMHLSG
eukprot:5664407-Prymnesium_polylepis.1